MFEALRWDVIEIQNGCRGYEFSALIKHVYRDCHSSSSCDNSV